MNDCWNLERIYNGYESVEFKNDFKKAEELVKEFNDFDYGKDGDIESFKKALLLSMKMIDLFEGLFSYSQLRMSVNSSDYEALKMLSALQQLEVESNIGSIKLNNYIKTIDNFMDKVNSNEELKVYSYYCLRLYDEVKRMMSDEAEIIVSKLERNSGSAWERLFDTLTSTLEVDYDGKVITLSEVRNLAYSSDPVIRKKAYEAEIKSYKKIEKPIAATLSAIKQEVTTLTKAHGFSSPLEATLNKSGMTKKTLDALISAIEDYFPIFRKYLRRKGELLGHKNGLPFYDLFAPIGEASTKYTIKDAHNYLCDRFSTFSKEISDMMDKAFNNEWIDFYPRKGKVGGAFCSPVFKIKESRILTNFDGTFGAVSTLAHELGHAYHNEVLWNNPIVHFQYPMQLAETASTFNETFVRDDAINNAKSNAELINILESSIADDNQVITDIMSRYYFETYVFNESDKAALNEEELCKAMIDAQLKSYGDGLDKDYLHPYMWCCKSHYYSTGLSFYNFPYAFGQLFAYGLYSIYKEKKEAFFPLYKDILKNAGQMPIRECVLKAGIDVEDKAFWTKSLDIIKERIEKFLELTNF